MDISALRRTVRRRGVTTLRLLTVPFLVLMLVGCTLFEHGRIDPATVAASPFAQIEVVGDHGRALMVLGNDDAGLTSWYSPDRRIVFLRNGALAGTSGLAQGIVNVRFVGEDPFVRLAEVQIATTLRRYDWMPGYRFGVEVHGELRRGAVETVDILGVSYRLQRFDETLSGPGVRATNTYWAEPKTGFILRSRQFVAPGAQLEITQLKPYRGTAR